MYVVFGSHAIILLSNQKLIHEFSDYKTLIQDTNYKIALLQINPKAEEIKVNYCDDKNTVVVFKIEFSNRMIPWNTPKIWMC